MRSSCGVVYGDSTANRTVLDNRRNGVGCSNLASHSTCDGKTVEGDVCILDVQALERCRSCAEQWSSQVLDCITVTIYGTSVTLDWSPLNACHIDILGEDSVHCQAALSLNCSLELCQLCSRVDNEQLCVWNVNDAALELANIACYEWLALASLNGSVHNVARVTLLVESDVELVVLTSRNCNVDVLSSRCELQALAERVLDNALRCSGCGQLACLEVDAECASDRSTVDSRNLSLSQYCLARYTNLEHTCEVVQLDVVCILAVAVHCRYATSESVACCNVRLLLCEENLSYRSCRVSNCIGCSLANCESCTCWVALVDLSLARLDSVYRNLIACAPVNWIEAVNLLAELGTRLLQRERQLYGCAVSTAYLQAEILSRVGDAREREHSRYDCHENFCQIFHLAVWFFS